MQYKDNSSDWLYFAESDLHAAKSMLRDGIYHLACFHAQQTIEKSLKAIIRHTGKPIPRTHSLAKLSVETGKIDNKDLYFVDQFYTPSRYPDTFPGSVPEELPTREDAQKAIEIAKHFFYSTKAEIELK